jgi:hypothetical protein
VVDCFGGLLAFLGVTTCEDDVGGFLSCTEVVQISVSLRAYGKKRRVQMLRTLET